MALVKVPSSPIHPVNSATIPVAAVEYDGRQNLDTRIAILQAGTNCACFRRRKSEVYSRLQYRVKVLQIPPHKAMLSTPLISRL